MDLFKDEDFWEKYALGEKVYAKVNGRWYLSRVIRLPWLVHDAYTVMVEEGPFRRMRLPISSPEELRRVNGLNAAIAKLDK